MDCVAGKIISGGEFEARGSAGVIDDWAGDDFWEGTRARAVFLRDFYQSADQRSDHCELVIGGHFYSGLSQMIDEIEDRWSYFTQRGDAFVD